MTPALIGALLLVLQGAQSPTVRIDSREQGRTFYVDPDHPEILRLRDSTAQKEYDLSMSTMLRYARSVPLEPSARGDFPPWLAFYPNAKVVAAHAPPPGWRPQTGADMRSFNIELNTTASVAEVAAFYREAFTSNGLTILTESQSQERSRFLEARSSDRMHRVTVNIRRGPRDTHVRLMDHYTLPRP